MNDNNKLRSKVTVPSPSLVCRVFSNKIDIEVYPRRLALNTTFVLQNG